MLANYEFNRITNEIIKNLVKSGAKTPADLDLLKRKLAKKYKISCPSNISLLKAYHALIRKKSIKISKRTENLLITRPVRSLSGIVNISVLTKPYPCPGRCLYCPKERGIPKSYLSGEPAVERAKKLKYNPYLQTAKRIEMLESEGHPTDKIELRIVGGTWSYYPGSYQEWFVKECFRACNEFELSKNPKSKILNPKQIPNHKIQSLETEQIKNEGAKHKIIGLSIETRPDFISQEEIKHLRFLGVTMVELGVQSIYDDVLKTNRRGHTTKETVLATKLLKDAGFKVLYQMMPNLPGSNLKKDEKMFEEIFSNSDFRPDLLKIYPCALLKSSPLYRQQKDKKYKPYNEKQLTDLIISIKKKIPYYVRIQRITRDIPSTSVVSGGAKISNLRQLISNLSEKDGWKCKCIRCREIRDSYDPKEKIYLFRQDYKASGGRPRRKAFGFQRGGEIFLSFENKNRTKLYSLLRLRINSDGEAIIREIHTYGQMISVAEKAPAAEQVRYGVKNGPQHQGLGKKLIKEAEKITKKEFKINKIAVISGVGVRDYFEKLGYELKKTYMVKTIK